jgi:hypothetical protein
LAAGVELHLSRDAGRTIELELDASASALLATACSPGQGRVRRVHGEELWAVLCYSS